MNLESTSDLKPLIKQSEKRSNPKPWYSIFGGRYLGNEPWFYDSSELPWIKVFEKNWEAIRDEAIGLINKYPERLQPYAVRKSMSFPPRQWKTLGFMYWRFTKHENCRQCPTIHKILKSIPNLTAASISALEPGSNINPHQGDTDAIIRTHLALSIPCGLPDCGFQVGKEIKPWTEGKTLSFCDAHNHTAWNQSNHRRIILIFDVIRPEFTNQTNSICCHVLASSVIQMLYQSSTVLNKLPSRVKRILYFCIRMSFHVVLPIQRRFSIRSLYRPKPSN